MKMGAIIIVGTMVLCASVATGERQLIDLGTLGAEGSYATAINNSGQVVGTLHHVVENLSHAFLYSDAIMWDLGTLEPGANSSALGINSSGTVIGLCGGGTPQAFLYSNGTMTDMGSSWGYWKSGAYAVNSTGDVVGSVSIDEGDSRAFVYSSGTLRILQGLGGNHSAAAGINDSGLVTGTSIVASGKQHAFVYDGTAMTDLGTLGGSNSGASGINDLGQVVGTAELPELVSHAFLWSNGVMQDLGTLGNTSVARDINNHGQIVGLSRLQDNVTQHAFIWENGVMKDLNTFLRPEDSGWVLTEAAGINDSGWVCGTAMTTDGVQHAYILTPEPTTLLLLGTGLCLVRRFRK